MSERARALHESGVSIWLDDLDRQRLTDGSLQRLIDQAYVTGVTTNPAIFHKALTSGHPLYSARMRELVDLTVDDVVTMLAIEDVRAACDLFAPVYSNSGGQDGRVSIEVDPRLAHDTPGTIQAANDLWQLVDRPNALIKIPATEAGLPAITDVLANGISVNVTLIFSVERYREVLDAWHRGVALAEARGHDITTLQSVASFFVSRVDTLVDGFLTQIGGEDANRLLGTAAIANAQRAWAAFREFTQRSEVEELQRRGVTVQRPLWASTGVKNPDYSPTRYVDELVAPGCVNTMPEATLSAVLAESDVRGNTLDGTALAGDDVWERLSELGVSEHDVFEELERDGVAKFIDAWEQLLHDVGERRARDEI